MLLVLGLPFTFLEIAGVILWIVTGKWQLFALWAVLIVPVGFLLSRMYLRHVSFICPRCHKVMDPRLKVALFANHTPHTRKLTCTCCGHKGFCVETYRTEEK